MPRGRLPHKAKTVPALPAFRERASRRFWDLQIETTAVWTMFKDRGMQSGSQTSHWFLTRMCFTKRQWDNLTSCLQHHFYSTWVIFLTRRLFLPFLVVGEVPNYIFFTPLKFATFSLPLICKRYPYLLKDWYFYPVLSLLTIMYSSLYYFLLTAIPVLLKES